MPGLQQLLATHQTKPAAQRPAPFTHTPRPPILSEAPYQNQRHYGDRDEAKTLGRFATVRVFRFTGDPIELTIRSGDRGAHMTARVEISAAQARDLARRLIDAAADFEAEVGSANQLAEAAS